MKSVKRYTKMEGNKEIEVQIINQDVKNVKWIVIYRFGGIEREEYFTTKEEAYKIADWVLHQGYKLIKVASIELI